MSQLPPRVLTVGLAGALLLALAGPADAATTTTIGTTAGASWARPTASLVAAPSALLDAGRPSRSVRVVSLRVRDGHPSVSVATVTGRAAALAAIARAQTSPGARSVAVDAPVHADALPSSDPSRSAQWALDRLGAETVWPSSTGAGVTVAVVDSGVDARHPDLAGRVLPGTDLVAGGDGTADGYGHGTHVAGVVAAVAGNGIGGAGLAPGASVLPVRVLDDAGNGWASTTAAGVIWAVDHGAQIVNLSLGSPTSTDVSRQAVDYASAHGVLVVAAGGNSRATGNQPSYPAAYDSVLGVAATDQADASAVFSTTGSFVDVAAPGVSILSTYKAGGYATMSGTSMATPYVSASAALVKAANPSLTPVDLIRLLEQSASDLGVPGRDDATGFGLVSPDAAVCLVTGCAPAAPPAAAPVATTLTVDPGPRTLPFRGTVRGAARLVAAPSGTPVAGAVVRLCRRAAPARTETCIDAVTDATGLVGFRYPAVADLTVHASYAGGPVTSAASAAEASYAVVARAVLRTTRHTLVATVRPGAGQRVTLLRRRGAHWAVVAHRVVDRAGHATFRRLAGARYRVTVARTRTLHGATSAMVLVR